MDAPTDSASTFWGLLHMLKELVDDTARSNGLLFYPSFTEPGQSVFVIEWEDSTQQVDVHVRLTHSNQYKLIDDAISKFLELHPERKDQYYDRRSHFLTIEDTRGAAQREKTRSEVTMGVGA